MHTQALLCSQHMSEEVGGCVERLVVGGGEEVMMGGGEEVVVGDGEEVTGSLSLKLLTWPHTGRMTEVNHMHVWVIMWDHVRS